MKTIPENSGPRELVDSIKNGMWPVYANIESKNQIKIISTDELFSYHSLSDLVPELEKIEGNEKIRLLNRLLLKSNLKRPVFNSDDFNDVRVILE